MGNDGYDFSINYPNVQAICLIYVDLDDLGNGSYRRYLKDSYFWYQKLLSFGDKIPKDYLDK